MQTLTAVVQQYIRRAATEDQLCQLFASADNFDKIYDVGFPAKTRGEFIEFLRQEWLAKNGYVLYDKHGKAINGDFHYSGNDRADVRAVYQDAEDPSNVRMLIETGKILSKTAGVGALEIEGLLPQAQKLIRQLNVTKPKVALGALVGASGVSKNLDKWFNSVRVDYPFIDKIDIHGPDDQRRWFKNLAVHYKRNGWQYDLLAVTDQLPELSLWWHQERLCQRWTPQMLVRALRLLIVWGCRTGKTVGSLSLLRSYVEAYDRTHPDRPLRLRVAIVCALPTLFDDWKDSIQRVFGDHALIHHHRAGRSVENHMDRHVFILSSSQMLNEADREQGVDKETNKRVMFGQRFDVLIYDEGHLGLLADNTYQQVVKKIRHQHLIGLTATPFRVGLQDDSVFEDRDLFDYWQQMAMKDEGHPDYVNVAQRYLFIVNVSDKARKIFKDLDLVDLGANITSIYQDSRQMQAAIYLVNETVFKPINLLRDNQHQVRDVIIRADGVPEGQILLDALRAFRDPVTGRGLDDHLFGFVTGSKSDLPGVESGYDGISADEFKTHVGNFFAQRTKHRRKVLIVVGQGIVGHTFKTVNTTVDLTNGDSLATKYQFWDRGGTQYEYEDGYVKNTYYHFDLNPFRMYAMAKGMRDAKRADRQAQYDEERYFDLLNLYEIQDGLQFRHINQAEFKHQLERMLERSRLTQILPRVGDLVVNDGVFSDFKIGRLKNGFGATSFDEQEQSEDDPDRRASSKKSRIDARAKKSRANIESNSKHAVDRLVNVLPMLAAIICIENRSKSL